MNKNCLMCGKIIYKKKNEGLKYWSTKRFCSYVCMGKSFKPYKRTDEHKERMKLAVSKLDKTKDIERMRKINFSRKGLTLEKIYGEEKAAMIRKKLIKYGKENNNWKGGQSFKGYGFQFNKKLKLEIKQRDGMVCKNCFITDSEESEKDVFRRGLTIHHIDYNKQNNGKSNLITLCRKCNSQANGNKEIWIKKYQQLLSV